MRGFNLNDLLKKYHKVIVYGLVIFFIVKEIIAEIYSIDPFIKNPELSNLFPLEYVNLVFQRFSFPYLYSIYFILELCFVIFLILFAFYYTFKGKYSRSFFVILCSISILVLLTETLECIWHLSSEKTESFRKVIHCLF